MVPSDDSIKLRHRKVSVIICKRHSKYYQIGFVCQETTIFMNLPSLLPYFLLIFFSSDEMKRGFDPRFRKLRAPRPFWSWAISGCFCPSPRPCVREFNTHTHQMNNKTQRIEEIFYVKTPVVLSKNICAYPPYNNS